jgi:hypothetical protein
MSNIENHFILLNEINNPLTLIEKDTNKIILQHPNESNKILSEDDIINKENNIMEVYGGQLITLFNYDDKWYSLNEIEIMNTIPIEFNNIMNELNKDYYYLFMFNNNSLIKKNNKFNLIYIKQKYDLTNINDINIKIFNKQKRLHFSCLNELHLYLENISQNNNNSYKLTLEGLILLINNTYIKLQTECYKNVIKLKPTNKNIHIGYLELYQKDLLLKYLPFDTEYSVNILKRINISLKTLSEEILNIYHLTRNNKNIEIYNSLPDIYKNILYEIHNNFISLKNNKNLLLINLHHIYYYIKNLDINKIVDLYKSRSILEENCLFTKIINKNCIYTKTQLYLLSKN